MMTEYITPQILDKRTDNMYIQTMRFVNTVLEFNNIVITNKNHHYIDGVKVVTSYSIT